MKIIYWILLFVLASMVGTYFIYKFVPNETVAGNLAIALWVLVVFGFGIAVFNTWKKR